MPLTEACQIPWKGERSPKLVQLEPTPWPTGRSTSLRSLHQPGRKLYQEMRNLSRRGHAPAQNYHKYEEGGAQEWPAEDKLVAQVSTQGFHWGRVSQHHCFLKTFSPYIHLQELPKLSHCFQILVYLLYMYVTQDQEQIELMCK